MGIAAECLAARENPRVLEFGCGDGDVLASLSERWWAVGLERRLDDLRMAQACGAQKVVAAEGGAPPFLGAFDLVGLFDVVEHVEDDLGLLRRAAGLAVGGGWILLTVPSDPRLWSSLDVYAGHHRRYTRRMLVELLEGADLRVEGVLPLFRMLWPLARVKAVFQREKRIADPEAEYRVPPWLNRLLLAGLSLERRIGGGSARGVGTSWLAVARTQEERSAGE